MKAFIVAALLVAAVAGQSTMDILKFNKEKSLLNKFDRPMERDLLLKKLGYSHYPVDTTYTYGDNIDMSFYNHDEIMDKQVLVLDEVMVHPLFREYITLPLFRQYWTYPAFQKYVTSVYFQKFWHIPAFKQYFVNPVYFYKYIYPIVTLFKTDFTIPTTMYGDELIKGDMIVNKEYPVVTGFERDLLKDNLFVPTMYNQDLKHKDDLLVKSLLVKIYSHLYNIPEELIKDQFFGKKIVDPMTGEIKYYNDKYTYPVDTFKTFDTTVYGDKHMYPVDTFKTMDSTMFGDKLVKDELLKKLFLNKMMHEDTYKTIPEEYILREKMMKMNPIVGRMMYGYNKLPTYNKFDTIDTVDKMNMFDMINMKKDLVKDDMLPLALKKELLLKDKILYNKIFNDKIFNDKIFNDKIFNDKIFNDKEINTFGTFETVPKVVDFNTPMMGVRTFDKKVFPETMIKA